MPERCTACGELYTDHLCVAVARQELQKCKQELVEERERAEKAGDCIERLTMQRLAEHKGLIEEVVQLKGDLATLKAAHKKLSDHHAQVEAHCVELQKGKA